MEPAGELDAGDPGIVLQLREQLSVELVEGPYIGHRGVGARGRFQAGGSGLLHTILFLIETNHTIQV